MPVTFTFTGGEKGGSATALIDGNETTNRAPVKAVISANGRCVAFVSEDARYVS